MKSINGKWQSVTNPPITLMTNNFVNYFEGVTVTQQVVGPTHTLPSSYIGKKFHISNHTTSVYPVNVVVGVQGGAQTFSIEPGDSGIFVFTGDGIWDQTGGEDVVRQIVQNMSVSTNQSLRRIISYNTPADSGGNAYIIGNVPSGNTVTDISVEISTPFNDPIANILQIQTTIGAVVLLADSKNDIKAVGTYRAQWPSLTNPINGEIRAIFNTGPAVSGGSAGIAGISIDYTEL